MAGACCKHYVANSYARPLATTLAMLAHRRRGVAAWRERRSGTASTTTARASTRPCRCATWSTATCPRSRRAWSAAKSQASCAAVRRDTRLFPPRVVVFNSSCCVAYACFADNSVNGVPNCASDWLIKDVARGEWGFEGCKRLVGIQLASPARASLGLSLRRCAQT